MTEEIRITIVSEQTCPECGGGDEFHNRPKVCDEQGWWWRCYNPLCSTDYYLPEGAR